MNLRTRLVIYLVVVHLLMAALAAFLFRESRELLVVAEIVFATSLFAGYRLVDSLFVPLRLIGTGAELIAEKDFTSHFRVVGQPEMDALIRVYNEMIDRLREERLRLEEQSTLLERIARVSPSGILVCDHDGLVRQVNPAAERLLAVSGGAILGTRLAEQASPALRILSELAKGESRVVSSGSLAKLRCQRAEFVDRGFPRSFYLVEEITEELRVSERAAYEKLIRMIAHEVRNSVGAVGSLLQSGQHYVPQLAERDRDDFGAALRVAQDRLASLDRFVTGFAEVVGLPEPDRRPTDLAALLRDIGTLVRPELDPRRIALELELPEGPIEARIDKNQFEQLLLNLVKNAWEAIGTDGRVRLAVSANGRNARLAVADSGPGIDPATAQQLFTPFFTTKREGRGIGLTLVREIAAQHGAGLSFRNLEGGGSEFAVVVER
jgi:nitrogen fixation/metabolism regulation signal transduction histidine kinase